MITSELALHTKQITDAIFGGVVRKKTSLQDTLALAKELKISIESHKNIYADHRGNIDESIRTVGDIILNLEGQIHDIADGIE